MQSIDPSSLSDPDGPIVDDDFGPDLRDRHSSGSLSSVSCLSSSSSENKEFLQPRFEVKIIPNSNIQIKDAELLFKVNTKQVNSFNEVTIVRSYDDFEQLNQILINSVSPGYGILFPPFPSKNTITSTFCTKLKKEKLGPNTQMLMEEKWNNDCWYLEEYTKLMLNHPVFGKESIWEQFLFSPDALQKVKVKKSPNFISRFSENMEIKGKTSHKDCEEYFQIERDWNKLYSNAIKKTKEAFDNLSDARTKLVNVLDHFSTTLNINYGNSDSHFDALGLKLSNIFSIAIDDYRRGLEVINYSDKTTLGCMFGLWTKFIDAEKDMLLRRTGLMIDYEKSNKYLDKAKPNRKDNAEKSKLEAEKMFDECSEMARQEIKRFHRQRATSVIESIEKYKRTQLLVNKDIHHLLQLSFENLKHFQL